VKVGILKNDSSMYLDETGNVRMGEQPGEQPMGEEKQKPLYGNKENMGIAHYLANDIVQLVDVLHSMYGDDNPHWERIKYDVQRLKSLLEEALQG
jgi:hypothetical protein